MRVRARAQLVRAAAAAGLCVACVPRTPAAIAVDAPADCSTAEDDRGRGDASSAVVRGDGTDRVAPEVTTAELVDRRRIRLRFSEPVIDAAAADPRQFRISYAYSLSYDEVEAVAYYVDPLVAAPPPGPPPGIDPSSGKAVYESDPARYDPVLEVVSLRAYADGESLGLELSAPIPLDLCLDVADARADLQAQHEELRARGEGATSEAAVGVYLHYTGQGGVPITDRAGNPMADVGGHWALNRGARTAQLEGRPPVAHLDRLIPIPCPVDDTASTPRPAPPRRPASPRPR